MIEDTTVHVGEGLSVTVPADQAATLRSDVSILTELFEREQEWQQYIASTFPNGICKTFALQKLAELTFWLGESLIRGAE